MDDRFLRMAATVQAECESYALRASIDGRRRVIADALREASCDEEVAALRAEIKAAHEMLDLEGVGRHDATGAMSLAARIDAVETETSRSLADACEGLERLRADVERLTREMSDAHAALDKAGIPSKENGRALSLAERVELLDKSRSDVAQERNGLLGASLRVARKLDDAHAALDRCEAARVHVETDGEVVVERRPMTLAERIAEVDRDRCIAWGAHATAMADVERLKRRAFAWKRAAKKAFSIALHNGREVTRQNLYLAVMSRGGTPGEAAERALANVAQWLIGAGFRNSASIAVKMPDIGMVTLAVQRHDGKTPHDVIAQKEAELERLVREHGAAHEVLSLLRAPLHDKDGATLTIAQRLNEVGRAYREDADRLRARFAEMHRRAQRAEVALAHATKERETKNVTTAPGADDLGAKLAAMHRRAQRAESVLARGQTAADDLAEARRQLRIAQEALRAKSVALDALHHVWCSGGCKTGVHRLDGQGPEAITPEVLEAAERGVSRLFAWAATRANRVGDDGLRSALARISAGRERRASAQRDRLERSLETARAHAASLEAQLAAEREARTLDAAAHRARVESLERACLTPLPEEDPSLPEIEPLL